MRNFQFLAFLQQDLKYRGWNIAAVTSVPKEAQLVQFNGELYYKKNRN